MRWEILYVHLGEDILVRDKDIVAIIDKDSVNSSQDMDGLLDCLNKSSAHLTFKSIVITKNNVYCSPLSSGTIKKRIFRTTIQEFD